MSNYDVVVIGAGLTSLATAQELKRAGKRILVLEKRNEIGGAFHVMDNVDDRAVVTMTPNGPFALAPENMSAHDRAAWPQFTELMHKAAGFLEAIYEEPAPKPIDGGLGDLFSMALLGRRARKLGREHMIELLRIMPMSVAELLGDHFESEPLKATIAAQGIRNLHQGPMSAGTVFTLLHYHIGQARGGFRLNRAVKLDASSLEIRTNAPVDEIVVENARAIGVRVNNEVIKASAIVSGLDVKTTLIDLLDVALLDPEFLHTVQHVRSRGVVARLVFELSRMPRIDGVSEGTVMSIGPTVEYLEHAYDDVKYDRVSQRPLIEARFNGNKMNVSMQYVPYDADPNEVAKRAIEAISEYVPGFSDLMVSQTVHTPKMLQREYGLPQGNVEHAELALDQILFMRPVPECARHATPIENLFLCGAGTHPGRVMPQATARHVTKTILRS